MLFQTFAPWDDEGSCIVALDLYFHSNKQPLSEVLNQYGPVYYYLNGLLMALTGMEPGPDSARWTSLGLWWLGTLLLSLIILRITGSWSIASVGFLLIFESTTIMINEPGHPQYLVYVLLASTLAALLIPKRPQVVFAGVLTTLMIFLKVNAGAFLWAGVVWHFLGPWRSAPRLLRGIFAFCLILGPLVMMKESLGDSQGWPLLALVLVLMVNLIVTTLALEDAPGASRSLWLFVASSVGTSLFFVLALLGSGVSMQRLFLVMVGQHMGFASSYFRPPLWTLSAVFISLVGSAAWCFRGKILAAKTKVYLAAPAVWLVSVPVLRAVFPEQSTMADQMLVSTPWFFGFLWLTFCLSNERARRCHLLFCVGVPFLLYIYPVSGSQTSLSMVTLLVLGIIALADLPGWLPATLALVLISLNARQTVSWYEAYQRLSPSVVIQSRLRLPEYRWLENEWLTWNLRYNCESVATFDGSYSVINWAGKESVVTWIHPGWTFAYPPEDVRELLQIVAASANLGVIVGPRNLDIENDPNRSRLEMAKDFILNDLELVAQYESSILMVKKDRKDPWNLLGAWREQDGSVVLVVPFRLDQIGGIDAISLSTLSPLSIESTKAPDEGIFGSSSLHFRVQAPPSGSANDFYLRVWSRERQLLARFPICTPSEQQLSEGGRRGSDESSSP